MNESKLEDLCNNGIIELSNLEENKSLPQPNPDQLEAIKAGLQVRHNNYEPYDGTSYFHKHLVLNEDLYFSVEGSLHTGKKIYKAIYLLTPAWGFENQFTPRVSGYQVMNDGQDEPGPLKDFACLSNNALKVKFANSPSKLY